MYKFWNSQNIGVTLKLFLQSLPLNLRHDWVKSITKTCFSALVHDILLYPFIYPTFKDNSDEKKKTKNNNMILICIIWSKFRRNKLLPNSLLRAGGCAQRPAEQSCIYTHLRTPLKTAILWTFSEKLPEHYLRSEHAARNQYLNPFVRFARL